MERGNRKIDREEDRSQVKLYKTRHGWVSCLTRFFHLLSFGAKSEVRAEQFVNPDDLKDHVSGSTESYLKGMSVLGATMLGIGGAAAVAPTTVHAATETAGDQGSVVLGSASQASASTSQSTSLSQDSGSTSGSTSNASTSGSTSAASNSSSTSGQQSNSGSLTNGSTSQASTSGSMNSESAAQISASESTSASAATNSLSIATSTSVADSVSIAESQLSSTASRNQLAGLSALANFVAIDTSTHVASESELRKALDDGATEITLDNDIQINHGTLTIGHSVTINGNGHTLTLGNNHFEAKNLLNDVTFKLQNMNLSYKSYGVKLNANKNFTVIFDDVQATGGTLAWANTYTPNNGNNTFVFSGNTTVTADAGSSFFDFSGTTVIYGMDHVEISAGANVTFNNNNVADYTIQSRYDDAESFVIDKNATVTFNGAKQGNILLEQNHAGEHTVVVGENATLNMTATGFNIKSAGWGAQTVEFRSGSKANLITTGNSSKGTASAGKQDGNIIIGTLNNRNAELTIKIDPNAAVTMTAPSGVNNIAPYGGRIVNVDINNPEVVVLNNGATSGDAYGNKVAVNLSNANVKVNDGKFTDVIGTNSTVYTGTNTGTVTGSTEVPHNC